MFNLLKLLYFENKYIERMFFYSFMLSLVYYFLNFNELITDYFYKRFTIVGGSVSFYAANSSTPRFVVPLALAIMSLIFITFSFIISSGIKLQEENDLTV